MTNIVLLSQSDCAGSGWLIKKAVETQLGPCVTHIRLSRISGYNYPTDIEVREANGNLPIKNIEAANKAINDADIIHCKGDDPIKAIWPCGIRIPLEKPSVLTVGGSDFRRHRSYLPSSTCNDKVPISEFVKNADMRTVLTPDLNYPEFRGVWIPFAIDCASVESCWHPPPEDFKSHQAWHPECSIRVGAPACTSTCICRSEGCYNPEQQVIIGHSPSSRDKKGTNAVLIPAIRLLNEQGYKIKLKILEGLPHQECIDAKRDITLFWDQCIVGVYGNSALEAMQFGIPTLCWLAPQAITQAQGGLDDCPVINFEPTVEDCARAIKDTLYGDLEKVSKATREWMLQNHSLTAVGSQYAELYRTLYQKNS